MTVPTDKWKYCPDKALLWKHGIPFAVVTPDGRNAISQEAMVELITDLNHNPMNCGRVELPAIPSEEAKRWSRRYICHFCGFKGRVGVIFRGPVVRCAACKTATPARLITETLALDAELKQNEEI
jgi:predicted RNA-binding Zn-ribbon protein involved in translation (DUF1610 family)